MSSVNNPIICGPMLRKVTKDSVSVFIALDTNWKVELRLYENDPKAENPNSSEVAHTENTQPKRIGKNLWVLVITINSLSLDVGVNYFYDIVLYSDNGLVTDLKDLGFLDVNNSIIGFPLGYSEYHLPSFSLPPALENLNIIHGSCRKPHGGGEDQLAELDNLILKGHNDPLKRPHQLFLTGDQIYADDVAAELFKDLTKSAQNILGFNESISYTLHRFGTTSNKTISHGDIYTNIDTRKNLMDLHRKIITSGKKDYHLIFLSEFYIMYLFVWSGYMYSYSNLVAGDYLKNHADTGTFEDTNNFLKKLPNVRRALANIPTYMIFDDHDVTDDWNIDKKWKDRSLNNNLSKTMIKNALTAYAIFQDWGNQPDKYVNNNDFWGAVEYKENNAPYVESLEKPKSNISKKLDGLLGLSPSSNGHSWNYHLEFMEHEVFILDTRTRRFTFPSDNGKKYVALIQPSKTSFEKQLPNKIDGSKLAIVISPAPILGMPIIEDQVQRRAVESVGFISRENQDYESWSGDPSTFYLLLEHLSKYKSTLILSGDVHYGYTNSCSLFSGHESNIKASRIIQLCSSSLKNTGVLTLVPAKLDAALGDVTNVVYSSSDIIIDNIPSSYHWILTWSHHGIQKIPYSKLSEFNTHAARSLIWGKKWENKFSNPSWFNPRKSKVVTFPIEVPRFCSEKLRESLNVDIDKTRGVYTLEYLNHDNSKTGTTHKDKRNKVFPNTNIGQINFKIKGSETYVIHKITNKEQDKNHHIFYCETLLSPLNITDRPSMKGDFEI